VWAGGDVNWPVTHPPGQDTEDAVSWWQVYQLVGSDQVDQLRERARGGDERARRLLAEWRD
jgi:hypothetical protein